MMIKRNQKGFTLVELLVTIAILGIITGMSIPLIRNIRNKNETKKFDTYGNALIGAAKLYKDSYEEDLFGHKISGCSNVTMEKLKEKKLINDFPDENISCNDENTYVKIIKLNNQYGYSYSLGCGKKNAAGKVEGTPTYYFHTVSKNEKRVIEALDEPSPEDLCNPLGAITISANPSKGEALSDSYKSKIIIKSSTGIESANIQYAWSESTDYHTITDWKTLKVNIPNITNQTEKVLNGVDVIIQTSNVSPPTGQPGTYYLYLKVNSLKDLGGEFWKAEDGGIYTKFGPFNIANKYILKYDDDNKALCNEEQITVYVKKNETKKWGTLCTPTKTGYNFTGWNKSKTGGESTKITGDTVANSNLTVYAQWSLKKLKVTFDCNGGSTNQEQTFTYGTANQKFEKTCTKTGYTLQGWAETSSATAKKWNVANTVTDNWINTNSPEKTIYAVWDAKSIKVTFDCNQGTGGGETTYIVGQANNKFDKTCTRSGYTMLGWASTNTATAKQWNTDNGVSDNWIHNNSPEKTIYAVWQPKTIKVNYNCNGGSGNGSQNFTVGVANQKFNNTCTKSGYAVLGWSASDTATTATWSVNNGVSDNWINTNSPEKTIYAIWIQTHTISYNNNNGSGTMTATTCKHNQDCKIANNTFTKTGYTFTGWKDSAGNIYNEGATIKLTANLTLTAQWRINVVKIRYKVNSGETIDTGTGQGFTNVGGYATKGGSNVIHTVKYGESMGSSGLADYNNKTWLNISRNNNCIAMSGIEWKSETKTFSQAKAYSASELCSTIAAGDCTLDLSVNWGKIVTIKYNMNGGSLASSHGGSIGHSGQWITVNDKTAALTLYNGCTTTNNGLADYNNSTYINIKKPSGKNNPTSKKEWNSKSNGSGTNYDQAKVYRGSDFCNAKTSDCTRELYVHWK